MFNSGDDIGAVVADVGSYGTRIGFAGEDSPRANFPTSIGRLLEPEYLNSNQNISSGTLNHVQQNLVFNPTKYRNNMEITSPVRDGIVVDWDLLEKLWNYALSTSLKADLKGLPVLISEKPYASPTSRRRLCEFMFEKHETAAFFLSKDAVLSCYAVGKSAGLVVDCGGSGTVVTPVSDGWVELKAVSRNSIGGRFMDAYMIQLVAKKLKTVPKPMYKLNKAIGQNNLTNSISLASNNASSFQEDFSRLQPSFDAYMNLELGRDIREAVCEVANSSLAESEAKFVTLPTTPYELPDGTIIDLGIERYQLPELFLDTSPLLSLSGSSGTTSSSSPLTSSELASIGNSEINSVAAGNSVYPITSDLEKLVGTYPTDSVSLPFSTESVPKMVIDSILKSENDVQSNLLNNLILTGGNSCYDGLLDRIRVEVERKIYLHTTGGYRLKMVANSDSERAIGAWLGGSILGSLGSFHEIWISKKEYEEYGSFIVDRKCP